MNKALFLDRDGTINVEKNYLFKVEEYFFEEGVIETLKYYYNLGYKIFVVTNQSGIARGYFSENDLIKLHDHLCSEARLNDFVFEEIVYCPHHVDGVITKYKKKCQCRKPGNQLIENLIKKYDIDRSRSYMIGDKKADLEAGRKSGLKTILVGTGYGSVTRSEYSDYDYYIEKFAELRNII